MKSFKRDHVVRRNGVAALAAASAAALPLVLASTASADPVMPGNPVSGWTFDGDYQDSFGSNDGTASGNPTFTSDAPFADTQSIDFDGNSHINFGNDASLQMTEALSVSLWVKSIPDISTNYLFSKYDIDGVDERGWAVTSGAIRSEEPAYDGDEYGRPSIFTSGTGSSFIAQRHGEYDIWDFEWRHIAVSYDGSTGGIPNTYIDGELSENWDTGGSGSFTEELHNAATDLVLGQRIDGSAGFGGLVAEAAVWDYAISAEEAEWLSQNSVGVIPEPGSLALLGAGGLMLAMRRRR